MEHETAVMEAPASERTVTSPETWEAIRTASIAGVSDQKLAEMHNVTQEAIRIRRFRDETWKKAFALSRSIIGGGNGDVTGGEKEASVAQKAALSIAESIQGIGQQNRLLALQIASKGLKRADQANLEVENWQDFKILVDSVAKLTGLEGGNTVQVNVLTDGSASYDVEDFPVIEADES